MRLLKCLVLPLVSCNIYTVRGLVWLMHMHYWYKNIDCCIICDRGCTVSVVVVTLSLSLGLQQSIPKSGESADHVNISGKMPIFLEQ